jgi:hypothetical protein
MNRTKRLSAFDQPEGAKVERRCTLAKAYIPFFLARIPYFDVLLSARTVCFAEKVVF